MKRIFVSIICLIILAGCSFSKGSNVNNGQSNEGMRVNNGMIQYKDSNGNWIDLLSTDELESLTNIEVQNGKDGQDGKDGVDGKNGLQGAQGIQGIPGPQGPQGPQGATGPAGQNGKDGKDGTQVTLSSEGELILDGKKTGFYLIKKESSSTPTPTVEPTEMPNRYKLNVLYFENGNYLYYIDEYKRPYLENGSYKIKDILTPPEYYAFSNPNQTVTINNGQETVIVELTRIGEPTPFPTYPVNFTFIDKNGNVVSTLSTYEEAGTHSTYSYYDCAYYEEQYNLPEGYSIVAPNYYDVNPSGENNITLVVGKGACIPPTPEATPMCQDPNALNNGDMANPCFYPTPTPEPTLEPTPESTPESTPTNG